MARRKRRKNAGPPPVGVSRKAAAAREGEQKAPPPKRRPGQPLEPSFRGVVVRAAIIAAIFYPYLVFVVGESAGPAMLVSLLAFALMVPLGLFIDRFRYSRQMKRWNAKQARQTDR